MSFSEMKRSKADTACNHTVRLPGELRICKAQGYAEFSDAYQSRL